MIGWLLTKLCGPKCPLGCGQRVYPNDVAWHYAREHAGD